MTELQVVIHAHPRASMPPTWLNILLYSLAPLAWSGVVVIGVYAFVEFAFLVERSGPDASVSWLDRLFPYGFLALGIFGLVRIIREGKQAVVGVRQGKPFVSWPQRPKPAKNVQTPLYPMTEAQKASFRAVLTSLDACGLLTPGELDFPGLVETAEIIEVEDAGISDVASVLDSHAGRRNRPFSRLAFFVDQVEFFEPDAVRIASEFARLSGCRSDIANLSVKILSRISGGLNRNAELRFELCGLEHRVPFELPSKNLPFDLMEKLAEILEGSNTTNRFVYGYLDAAVMVMFITDEQLNKLVEAFGNDPPWLEPFIKWPAD